MYKTSFHTFFVSADFFSTDMHHKTIIKGTLHKTENNTKQMLPCTNAPISTRMYITYTDAYITQKHFQLCTNRCFDRGKLPSCHPCTSCTRFNLLRVVFWYTGVCLVQWMEGGEYPPTPRASLSQHRNKTQISAEYWVLYIHVNSKVNGTINFHFTYTCVHFTDSV